ncbi:calmodulin [Aplysia californica]|uniref:Calmodulin n=1 Tax=Aplysia californica TaxID=6500 RepID=A0ABM0K9W6_APLCA|nr:calmodulin [Aplysia californica]
MASFTDEQMKEFQDVFRKFDRNSDGHINADEMVIVMRELGQNPTEEDVRKLIAHAEENTPLNERNRMIEFSEFVDMMEREGLKSQQEVEDELTAAFKVFDKNGDGYINREELKRTMQILGEHLTDDDVSAMMDEADSDGNGVVDYREFARIMSARK